MTRQINADKIKELVALLKRAKYATAFTGAGISVESGVPPFRGEKGIWNKYDPRSLELDYFYSHPTESWTVIREVFYAFFGKAVPNPAHLFLGEAEKRGFLKAVVTQNIDNLHQLGGSETVYEFHGNAQKLICTNCGDRQSAREKLLIQIPVRCKLCEGLVKPDFIFFGEGIPEEAFAKSMAAARKTDLMIVIGTLGEVMPAAMVPQEAKRNGATIVEINLEASNFTHSLTDLFIPGKAGEVCQVAGRLLFDDD